VTAAAQSPGRLLIVDDEASLAEFLEILLRKEGYEVESLTDGAAAMARLDAGRDYDLVVTDLMMPGVGGMQVLEHVKELFPDTEVLMMTAYAAADTAIEAMKKGAYDYVQKPFNLDEIRVVVANAIAKRRLIRENRALRAQVSKRYGFGNIIGRSPGMRAVFEVIERVAPTRTSILVTGESGTGKELIARALHHNSPRADRPLITVNCGAIPESLIESELFGYVKGAFTGATSDRKGMFAAADGGTIFLDEVGELPMHLQVKLLRVLQERTIRPVGATAEAAVDVRVVAATNQDLERAVRQGTFREDLYYRLNVIRVHIPPLRQRREDVVLIARHFLKRFCDEMGKGIVDFSPGALEVLMRYDFPGNVRELENLVERAVTFELSDRVTVASLPPHVAERTSEEDLGGALGRVPDGGMDLDAVMAEVEKRYLSQALRRTEGNRTEAAKLLGISFRSIRYKLDKFGLKGPDEEGAA
jgi:two-component system response regulator PilR (NtrC family)